MSSMARVLVVDDSAYMRVVLKDLLEADPEIKVIGAARDGLEAVEMAKALAPDVVLMDIQMPKMDGLATLQRMLKETPTRVVMLSAMDKLDPQLPLRALEMGAVDFISKPRGPVSVEIVELRDRIVSAVKNAMLTRVEALRRARSSLPEKLKMIRRESSKGLKVVAIGSSLGGPRALESVFAALPRDVPGAFFVIQHLPWEFSESFARRLDAVRGPRVKLATDGERVERGMAYVAPGGRHLRLAWQGASTLVMKLENGEPVNFVKPSADVLFRSVAECMAERGMGVILTGLGVDGARGALAIKEAGGRVIAQDEATSLAFGMPKATVEIGAAEKVLPLEEIPEEIIRFLEE